jgi:hypothetical protein
VRCGAGGEFAVGSRFLCLLIWFLWVGLGLHNMGILGFAPPPVPGMEYIWHSSGLVTVQYKCYHELTNVTFIMAIIISHYEITVL